MRRAHLVPLALAFLAGIVGDQRGFAVALSAAVFVFALALRAVPAAVRANVGLAVALGVLDGTALGHPRAERSDAHVRTFSAVVLTADARDPTTIDTTVRLRDGSEARVPIARRHIDIGERLTLRGERQVFDEPRNPGEPSERVLEAERGISWRLVHTRVIASAPVDPSDATLWFARGRAWASARLHATLDEPGATILAGALWGERGALPPDLRAEFQDTGTVHVLVTAGLHLGVVAALAAGLLHVARCGRVAASLAAIGVVWAYAAFSGAHLPSVRAATMLTFALLARAAGRDAFSWNGLAAAAIVVAALRPASVLGVSFGLSFSCVAAIFAFARPIADGLERVGVPRVAREALGVSMAAQLGTWPLSAATFLVIAPYAPLANAAVVPAVGVAMLAGFAAIVSTPIPALAVLANNVVVSLLDWIVGVVAFFGSLPGAHAVATPAPAWAIAAYALALIAARALVTFRHVRAAGAIVAGAIALCLWPPRIPERRLAITILDVGQADAILIRTPAGHAYLVDAGGRLERGAPSATASNAEEVGERIVVPMLVRNGIHHLDAIVLSHPHGDHAGGVAPVLRALGADGFADSAQRYGGHAYRDAVSVASRTHVAMLYPRTGTQWRTDDGVTFRFIGPSLPLIEGRNAINDNSLAFILQYGSFRMLFSGDAGSEAERRFLAEGVDLRANVLKVGHHGSAYGTTPDFIRAVRPQYAIVSVGRGNLFGHPAPATLDTLARFGSAICRTDEDGAVTVRTDGYGFDVRTMLGRGTCRGSPARAHV